MIRRDWVSDLESFLRERWATLCRIDERAALFPFPRIDPPLAEEEAQAFLRGVEEEIFWVREEGYFSSPMFAGPKSPEEQKTQNLFNTRSRQTGERGLGREGLCQMAAAADLVLTYGWSPDRIVIEPRKSDLGAGLDWAVDIGVFAAPRVPVILAEVKSGQSKIEDLVRQIRACAEKGSHGDCPSRQHNKWAALWATRPHTQYFWAVAPGCRRAYRLQYSATRVVLKEAPDIPSM